MTRKKVNQHHPWDVDFQFALKTQFDFNDVHRSFIALADKKSTKMVFADGPAGTAKTYLAVMSALKLIKNRHVEQIIYIRSVVESASQKMGSLPGEMEDKFLPYSMPMVEKLDEIVGVQVRQKLMTHELVQCIPVNYVRGLTFNDSVVIIDEAQNLTTSELTTILTRFGRNTKFIVVGDTKQSDINGKTGFAPIWGCFNNPESEENGIYTFEFGESEIVRSEILKFIVKQLTKIKK